MKHFLTLMVICWAFGASATHNRAGEITYRWLGGLTYEVRITTYTRSCDLCADRCELTINWGDGQTQVLPRANGNSIRCAGANARDGVIIDPANEIRKNVYVGQHTYAATGAYTVFFEDANRNAGINNIINSDQVPFYVESEVFIAPGLGANSSPILTNPPVERGCLNKRFEHNAGAFDPDGDSLSYRLVLSRTNNGDPISTIYDPQYVQDSIKIDLLDGTLIWDAPRNVGQFNFAFEIIEWRKNAQGRYTKIGYVTRDLQVDIEDCGNNPPVVEPVGPFCVLAGETLNFNVRATDPDGDDLDLEAFGGPFAVNSPADPFFFTGPTPLTGNFNWDTECQHVRRSPYQLTFKATDLPSDPFETRLSDLYTTEVRVIAPGPQNPSAAASPGEIRLNWERSPCAGAIGYKIFRRESLFGYVPDSCETGVPAYTGYVLLDSNRAGILDTSYVDRDSLQLGVEYCYMVTAYWADEAESQASLEFCASLPLSLPLMTKVDVESTDPANGSIGVDWVAPPELDSSLNPPPYRYVLQRATGLTGTNFQTLASFNGLNNTGFRDENLDTENEAYRYRVIFRSGPSLDSVGPSNTASSIYLQTRGVDEAVELSMQNFTPWQNYRYVIYRENPLGSGIFDSIAESFRPFYRDTGLVNGETYCYRSEAYGRYSGNDSLPAPLFNRSQINCATARDTIAPCTPIFFLNTACPDTLYFSWQQPTDPGCSDDVARYNIYYRPFDGSFGSEPVLTFTGQGDSTVKFVNDADLAGCFAMTASDDAGNDPNGMANESPLSPEVCVENCFNLELPNVFTPNNDGLSDRFLPLNFNQLEFLTIDIYNRWGVRVYQALSLEEFAEQGWDGTVASSGEPAAEGVYYYVCRYRPKAANQPREQSLTGFVHLFR